MTAIEWTDAARAAAGGDLDDARGARGTVRHRLAAHQVRGLVIMDETTPVDPGVAHALRMAEVRRQLELLRTEIDLDFRLRRAPMVSAEEAYGQMANVANDMLTVARDGNTYSARSFAMRLAALAIRFLVESPEPGDDFTKDV